MNEMLDSALEYAARGWRIFPVSVTANGRKKRVRPHMTNWGAAATSTDKDQITAWWDRSEPPSIGIATGPRSNLWVLDVDIGDGNRGDEVLADLEATYGPLPATLSVVTGSGGYHHYFEWADGLDITTSPGDLGPGLDVRGEGGFVIAPPSVHPVTERSYHFEHASLENPSLAPEWLIEKIERKRTPVQPSTGGGNYPDDSIVNRFATSVSWPELLEVDGAQIVDKLISSETGAEYERWSRGPFPEEQHYEVKVGATLNYMGTDRLRVFTTNWRTDEFHLEAGKAYSRFGYFVARHFGDPEDQGARNRAAAFLHDQERATKQGDESGVISFEELSLGLKALAGDESDESDWLTRLFERQLIGDELFEIPPPIPLIGNGDLLQRNSIAVMYGAPASGKSLVALDMALSLVRGMTWQGEPTDGTKALYIMAEGAHGMSVRVKAWFDAVRVGEDLGGMVWYPEPIPLVEKAPAAATVRWATSHSPDLIVVDTLAMMMAGEDENDSRGMGQFVNAVNQLRVETGACVLVVHHPGKDEGRGLRGHSSLLGAVYTEIKVTKAEGGLVSISVTKQKDGPDDFSKQLQMNPHAESVAFDEPRRRVEEDEKWVPGANHHAALNAMLEGLVPQGLTKAEWRELAEPLPKTTFYRCVSDLLQHRLVVEVGEGRTPRYIPGPRVEKVIPSYFKEFRGKFDMIVPISGSHGTIERNELNDVPHWDNGNPDTEP